MSRTDRRQQIVEIAHTVHRDLHWNTWKEMHPQAAELALPKIRDIIDEEIKSRCPRGHRSSNLQESLCLLPTGADESPRAAAPEGPP
jgi:hypothetical protein